MKRGWFVYFVYVSFRILLLKEADDGWDWVICSTTGQLLLVYIDFDFALLEFAIDFDLETVFCSSAIIWVQLTHIS